MAKLNLLDIAKLNGNDKVVGLIEENLTLAPEIGIFPARTIRGTSFYTVKRTGFPTVGFRSANAGIVPSKSAFAKQLTECFILSAAIQCDRAILDAHEDGSGAGEMIEASGVMKQALIQLGSQIWYGTTTDANGFPGIKALTPKTATVGTSTNVVDAAGTTATTASSVYAVKFSNQDVQIITGNNSVFELSPFRDQQIVDPNDSTKWLPGRVAELSAWVGLSLQNINCVGRILNVTADSGKTLTDTLIAQLLEKFPVGFVPDAIFMSRRSRRQLQVSRTVVINAGLGGSSNLEGAKQTNVAAIPTEAFGIPVYATDSILNTDALE